MDIEPASLVVAGIHVDVVHKPIRSLRITVQPPEGAVRVSAPVGTDVDVVRLALVNRLDWIKRQRAAFVAQPRQTERQLVTGETHYVFGRACRLRVVEGEGAARVSSPRLAEVVMHVRPGASLAARERALSAWYREQLKRALPPLVAKWERLLGVHVSACGIKRMKTRWGTCNARAGRVWLNLELAKKPQRCIEYIVAHELVHLVERTHGPRFVALMDQHMPQWRAHRAELNAAPLAHERWAGCSDCGAAVSAA